MWRKSTVVQQKAWWRGGRRNQQAGEGDTGEMRETDKNKEGRREREQKYLE